MAKIFIENITLLDCALLLNAHGPRGKSWRVDAMLEGQKDENGILFDFGYAKPVIKSSLDGLFDHKILVDSEQIRHKTDSHIIIASPIETNGQHSFFALNTYPSAVRTVKKETLSALCKNDFSFLEKEIEQEILKNLPQNIERIKITLKEDRQEESSSCFSYTHSLCQHCGNCQRFHGHSSHIKIYKNNELDSKVRSEISHKLDKKYFISEKHIDRNWNSEGIRELEHICPEIADFKHKLTAISYTGSQGAVALLFPKENVISLTEESTIENLAEFIHKNFFDSKPEICVHIYEGLAKGAVCP